MERQYKCLRQNAFIYDNYKLVPIRDEDKYAIMQWRNEQIEILRQKELLTKEQQELYFKNIVDKLFEQEKPNQLLFSFLENDILIGYGGLVHIDWESKNAEVSFLTETKRSIDHEQCIKDWSAYLKMLKKIAKEQICFNKIFTYAYDVRPWLYEALLNSGFIEEARLKTHIVINSRQYDVLIHSCFLNNLVCRMANQNDVMLYFQWANDEWVRKYSYDHGKISFENHIAWFQKKLESGKSFFYLFIKDGEFSGQVRIERNEDETIIGVSVDFIFRGLKLASKMVEQACSDFERKYPCETIVAYIKKDNFASLNSFIKADFIKKDEVIIKEQESYRLTR